MNALCPQPKKYLVALGLCLIAYLGSLYYPLITQAGISVDDWGDIAHNLSCATFIDCYCAWFPLFSNRPLAPLPITTLTFLFKTWYAGYLLTNSVIYWVAIGITAHVIFRIGLLRSFSGAIVFVLFAVIPMIAMPIITSPINQSTATVSLLLWAASLWSLLHFLQTKRTLYYYLSYALLLAAFLTYEVVLPLLVLTAFLPWIRDAKQYSLAQLKYWFKFIAPILAVLMIAVLWQKGIAPHFMSVDSRLKFIPSQSIAKLHTFFHVFYRQIPKLFWNMSSYLQWSSVLCAILGLASFYISTFLDANKTPINSKSPENPENQSINQRFTFTAFFCFLSSSFIFILSNESATVSGYQARGLSSTWFSFAILLCAMVMHQGILQKVGKLLIALLLAFCILSFSVQRDQTIRAWQMQLAILNDAIDLLQSQKVPAGATILGDVPHYLSNNYNDEIVFSQPWDFGAALALTYTKPINPGPVLDSSRNELRQLRIENGIVLAQNFIGSDLSNFWAYQFNSQTNQGTLVQIANAEQFESFIQQLAERAKSNRSE